MLQGFKRAVRLAVVTGFALLLGSSPAYAYTIANEVAPGCHEQITAQALRNVRTELATAAPLPLTEDENALVGDLEFVPDPDMRDLGGATLLASVRDNDLKGLSSDDLTALAEVHGDPANQQEHCLRGADEKEPGGSAAAVSACREFILGRAAEAIAGLDAAGMPDLNNRTSLTIYLSIRGQVEAPLPTYYVRIGQALHAIEDSFTHTYRTPDQMQITVVLDWVDQANGVLVESRDGPGHATALDRCDDPDALRKTRHGLATDAATAFLRATLDPQKTPQQKLVAASAVLDTYLTYSPGCTFDNQWCDAPEVVYANPSGCGCHVGSSRAGPYGMLPLLGLAILVLRRARRRRVPWGTPPDPRSRFVAVAVAALAATTLPAPSARAQAQGTAPVVTTTTVPASTPGAPATTETTIVTPTTTTTTVTAPTTADKHQPPPPTIIPVKEPGPRDATATAFGGYLGASGSVDRPALAAALGARLRVSKHWTFGLDAESNPWLSLTGATKVRAGVINVYGTAMLRFPLAYESFNLRTSVSLGTSYLLTTLYGAPSGSVGVYGGVSFLGVEWKVSRRFYLIVNPLNFAVPIPQLRGVPFLYPQYRLSVGLEVYAG